MLTRLLCLSLAIAGTYSSRTWKCEEEKCTKSSTDDPSTAVSVLECKLSCLPYGGLWPAPTGATNISKTLVTVDNKRAIFTTNDLPEETRTLLTSAQEVFLSRHEKDPAEPSDEALGLQINIVISNPNATYFTSDADESYKLSFKSNSEAKVVSVDITAGTFFGARHGLETLSQLIVFDDLHNRCRMPSQGSVEDKPVFSYRGFHLDTARSYFSVRSILKLIDGMSQNKLNSFHWHITDTHSFPYVSEAYPQMSEQGAYSAKEVYTQEDIRLIVEYARARGVRVTPELDAPAHVGEGWEALGDNLTTCFRWEPWTHYCVEPPCGQFDPTNERLYPILGTIFREWGSLFKSDLFHMGGDEVNLNCWRSTPRIVDWMNANNYPITDEGFLRIWSDYQTKSRAQLKSTQPSAIPVLWTSTITENGRAKSILDPNDYIVQVWTKKDDSSISDLIKQNFRVIFSNYDELYFDCGAGAWIGGPGLNWCAPYASWHAVYGHDPYKMLSNLGLDVNDSVKKLVLGSEAALWTEGVDEQQSDGKYFPRGAALAERLWSNPSTDWTSAQYRMNYHRERMVKTGIQAELLQPAWCYHNDGFCGLGQ